MRYENPIFVWRKKTQVFKFLSDEKNHQRNIPQVV